MSDQRQITDELLEAYQNQGAEAFEADMFKAAQEGQFPLDDIDFEQLMHGQQSESDEITEALKCINGIGDFNAQENQAILEESLDVMKSSEFDHLRDSIVAVGAWQRCMQKAERTLLGCVDIVNVDCSQTTLTDDVKVPDMADVALEEEETNFYGLCPPDTLNVPERAKYKFAIGHTREAFQCSKANESVRRAIDSAADQFNDIANKHIADHLMNLSMINPDTGMGFNQTPWIFNGVLNNPYQAAGSNSPYENYHEFDCVQQDDGSFIAGVGAPDLSGCSFDPLCLVENMEEDWLDPKTCEPFDCPTDRQILVASQKARARMMPLLGAMSLERDLLTGPNGEKCGYSGTTGTGPREGWDQDIKYDKQARQRLICYYEEVYGCTNQEAKLLADKFYAVGRPREAFAVTVEWETERLTREGNDTWEYFNQEIVYATKFMKKWGYMWKEPHLWQVFKPVPVKSGGGGGAEPGDIDP